MKEMNSNYQTVLIRYVNYEENLKGINNMVEAKKESEANQKFWLR
jgi:hypothetical protein